MTRRTVILVAAAMAVAALVASGITLTLVRAGNTDTNEDRCAQVEGASRTARTNYEAANSAVNFYIATHDMYGGHYPYVWQMEPTDGSALAEWQQLRENLRESVLILAELVDGYPDCFDPGTVASFRALLRGLDATNPNG